MRRHDVVLFSPVEQFKQAIFIGIFDLVINLGFRCFSYMWGVVMSEAIFRCFRG
jgi:hypothetical protein